MQCELLSSVAGLLRKNELLFVDIFLRHFRVLAIDARIPIVMHGVVKFLSALGYCNPLRSYRRLPNEPAFSPWLFHLVSYMATSSFHLAAQVCFFIIYLNAYNIMNLVVSCKMLLSDQHQLLHVIITF